MGMPGRKDLTGGRLGDEISFEVLEYKKQKILSETGHNKDGII